MRFPVALSPILICAVVIGQTSLPSTRPATRPSAEVVQALLKQLTADDWKARQQAQDKLVALGEDALNDLQKFHDNAADEESRTRAEAAIRQIRLDMENGPTLITLRVKNAKINNVLDQLSKQARTKIVVVRGMRSNKTLTLDVDREPFWNVMREVCRQSELSVQAWGEGEQINLGWGGDDAFAGPNLMSGCFMFIANSVQINRSLRFANPNARDSNASVELSAWVDPKLHVGQCLGTSISDLVTDTGESLLSGQDAPEFFSGNQNSGRHWELQVPMKEPPQNAKRIAKLRGSARFLVLVKVEKWEVVDPLSAKSLSRAYPVGKFTVEQVKKESDKEYTVSLVIEPTGNANADDDAELWEVNLIDAAGKKWGQGGTTSRSGGKKQKIKLSFRSWNEDAEAGPPAKLVWTIPVETKEVTARFEFKDLPLP